MHMQALPPSPRADIVRAAERDILPRMRLSGLPAATQGAAHLVRADDGARLLRSAPPLRRLLAFRRGARPPRPGASVQELRPRAGSARTWRHPELPLRPRPADGPLPCLQYQDSPEQVPGLRGPLDASASAAPGRAGLAAAGERVTTREWTSIPEPGPEPCALCSHYPRAHGDDGSCSAEGCHCNR